MTLTPTVGTISHGTLRTEDLLRRFTDALAEFGDQSDQLLVGIARALLTRLEPVSEQPLAGTEDEEDDESDDENIEEEAAELIDDLTNRLDEIAAQHGLYFGNTEGDGSDFGFWPIPESDENQP